MFIRCTLAGVTAAVLAIAGSAPAPAATKTLRASFDGTFEVAGPLLQFSGTGQGTHLGSASVEGASVLVPGLPSSACAPPKVSLSLLLDRVTVTAADGDQLVFRNSGTDCLDPSTGTIVADATYEILGGTGRFAGAGGSGRVTVVASCSDQLCTHGTFRDLEFVGSLS